MPADNTTARMQRALDTWVAAHAKGTTQRSHAKASGVSAGAFIEALKRARAAGLAMPTGAKGWPKGQPRGKGGKTATVDKSAA